MFSNLWRFWWRIVSSLGRWWLIIFRSCGGRRSGRRFVIFRSGYSRRLIIFCRCLLINRWVVDRSCCFACNGGVSRTHDGDTHLVIVTDERARHDNDSITTWIFNNKYKTNNYMDELLFKKKRKDDSPARSALSAAAAGCSSGVSLHPELLTKTRTTKKMHFITVISITVTCCLMQ